MPDRRLRAAALAAWLAAPAASAARSAPLFPDPPADADIFGPMKAELERSLAKLKLDDFGPPYFLAYRLLDEESLAVSASFGAVTRVSRDSSRTLYVEARFGDPSFDNTELRYHGRSMVAGREPEVLRQNLWYLTDLAYKAAVAGYLDRTAKRATERDLDGLADFSMEPAYVSETPSPPVDLDLAALKQLAASVSGEFRRRPELYGSQAHLSVLRTRRWLLTSEGTRIASPWEHLPVSFSMSAWTRAPDGMLLETHRSWVAPSPQALPEAGELREEARRLSEELRRLREAPLQEPDAAPALLDPEFTGVLFHEALGHKLEGPSLRDPGMAQIFRDRVGSQVLPAFLSVADDPTLREFRGRPLHGHYRYDEEGVPAQAVILVDHGVLKGFLLSRWPVKGFDRSNGHGRADKHRHPSGRMGSLMVTAHETAPAAELKARLMALARALGKPYGFWLRGSHGGENPVNRSSPQTLEVRPRLVTRVDAATGAETLVRGVKLVGTPLVILNRIAAAGDDMTLSNPFNCGAESGHIPVDQIAPSVLVSEVELQRNPEERARPALLPSPLGETR